MRHLLYIFLMVVMLPQFAEATNKDWKWNAPVNKDGGLTGKSIEVYPVRPFPPYYTRSADGTHNFEVPSIGAKTSNNTKYTRSEMSEMINRTEARWMLKDNVLPLRATGVVITQLPCGTRLVIGQIHGKKDELVRLYADNTSSVCGAIDLYYISDIAFKTGKETRFYLKDANGIPITLKVGEPFNYIITPTPTKVTVSASYKGVRYSAQDRVHARWNTDTFYYKWGAYFNSLLKGAVAKVSFRKVT